MSMTVYSKYSNISPLWFTGCEILSIAVYKFSILFELMTEDYWIQVSAKHFPFLNEKKLFDATHFRFLKVLVRVLHTVRKRPEKQFLKP